MCGSSLIVWASGSSDKAKKSGDSEQPCQVPRCWGNVLDRILFVCTTAQGLVYWVLIIDIKFLPNPKFPKICHRYIQLTRSKAFSASKLNIAAGCVSDSDACNIWKRRWILSDASLPFKEHVWSQWINLPIHGSNLLTNTWQKASVLLWYVILACNYRISNVVHLS